MGGDRHTPNTAGAVIKVGRCMDARVSDHLQELRKAGGIGPRVVIACDRVVCPEEGEKLRVAEMQFSWLKTRLEK